jgi:hypothetical protein
MTPDDSTRLQMTPDDFGRTHNWTIPTRITHNVQPTHAPRMSDASLLGIGPSISPGFKWLLYPQTLLLFFLKASLSLGLPELCN